MKLEHDKRKLLQVSSRIHGTSGQNVPNLLLEISEILLSHTGDNAKLKELKNVVWSSDILQCMVSALRLDYEHVRGSWLTAAKLSDLTCDCCIGFKPAEVHEFYDICLPSVSETLLMLLKKLQGIYIQTPNFAGKEKEYYLSRFLQVTRSLHRLIQEHIFILSAVMGSAWFMQLLLSEDAQTTCIIMNFLTDCANVDKSFLSNLEVKNSFSIFDELIYKLAVSDSPIVAKCTLTVLNGLCRTRPKLVGDMCTRYRGLKPLLSRWSDKGFNKELKSFIVFLDAGDAQRVEQERLSKAAALIQALVRGFLTRARLRKANAAFCKFHRAYRVSRVQRKETEDARRHDSELQHQLLMSRKQRMIDSRKQQLQMIHALPAGQVEQFLRERQHTAARTIQATWRGHMVRSRGLNESRKLTMRRRRAAVRIQRWFRRWRLRKQEKRVALAAWQRPARLSDARRVELQKIIRKRADSRQSKELSRAGQESLHQTAQNAQYMHAVNAARNRAAEQRRLALVARIDTDADLLLNAPSLDSCTESMQSLYVSHSMPIANRAREQHKETVRLLRQPEWWKKLNDCDLDS